VAFEAEGRALGVGTGPALVSRVVKTGRGSASASIGAAGGSRAVIAAAADIHSALTFPIRGKATLSGCSPSFGRRPPGRFARRWNDASVCHIWPVHRARSRRSGDARSRDELAALASTDALTGLKNRREFDRRCAPFRDCLFAVLSLDVTD